MEKAKHRPAAIFGANAEAYRKLVAEFDHPLWKKVGELAAKKGGGMRHGGMDYVMKWRIVECLRAGLPLDQDVYDAAAWSAVTPISETWRGRRFPRLHARRLERPPAAGDKYLRNKEEADQLSEAVLRPLFLFPFFLFLYFSGRPPKCAVYDASVAASASIASIVAAMGAALDSPKKSARLSSQIQPVPRSVPLAPPTPARPNSTKRK